MESDWGVCGKTLELAEERSELEVNNRSRLLIAGGPWAWFPGTFQSRRLAKEDSV